MSEVAPVVNRSRRVDDALVDETVALPVGRRVEVFNAYRHEWVPGFEIVRVDEGAYTLRREIDRAVLPIPFKGDELRAAR